MCASVDMNVSVSECEYSSVHKGQCERQPVLDTFVGSGQCGLLGRSPRGFRLCAVGGLG